MRKVTLYLLLSIVFCTNSCTKEDASGATIEIKNETHYKIDIYYKSRMGQENEINIPSYSNYSKSKSGMGGIYTNLNDVGIIFGDADTVQLMFSNKKVLQYSLNSVNTRNILYIDNYLMEVNRDKNYISSNYTYTITEEDYNNATPIEE